MREMFSGQGIEGLKPMSRRFRSTRRWMTVGTAILVVFAASVPRLMACPDCKENLDQQAGNLPFGFALSIGLMLATPIGILVGWVLTLAWYLRRQAPQVPGLIRAANHPTNGQWPC